MQNESNEASVSEETNQGQNQANEKSPLQKLQELDTEGMSPEELSLIEKLNQELAESGRLYAELSEEEDQRELEAMRDEVAAEERLAEAEDDTPSSAPGVHPEPAPADVPAASTDLLAGASPEASPEASTEDEPYEEDPWQADGAPETPEADASEALLSLVPAPLREALEQKGYAELTIEGHFTTWSMVKFLMEERPEAFAKLNHDLHGRLNSDGTLDSENLPEVHRESFKQHFGWTYAQFDQAWRDWVLGVSAEED